MVGVRGHEPMLQEQFDGPAIPGLLRLPGAGRRMSRNAARRQFTADDLAVQTAGVECRKDSGVLDEIPAAYKDIDTVIADQADLVEVVSRLKTLLCIKG